MKKEHTVEYVKMAGLKFFLTGLVLAAGLFGVFSYVKSNTDILDIGVSVSKESEVGLDEQVVLNFSGVVFPEGVERSLSVEPLTDFSLKWLDSSRGLAIIPVKNWQDDSVYTISITDGRGIFGKSFKASIVFRTKAHPKVISIVPVKGERNVLVAIEDPISINFDKPLDDSNIKLTINPTDEFVSRMDEQKMSVKILSKGELRKGTRYDMKVFIKHKSAPVEDYKQIFESYFETKPEEPKTWAGDITVRLAQAKNYTEARILEGKYIDINLKSQVMTIFENGEALDAYLVSSGKAGMNTPEGTFKIENKARKPWSKKYSLYMPYWMAITPSGEYGIHELPEWPGGYKEGANHLGIPVSHGCVRLGVGPANRVYDWAEIGTPVVIHQ